MIKAIIFDFDGVILESANIKTKAFKELFLDYPERMEEIIDYHLSNAGISRYLKFRHIYKHILRKELTKEKEAELGERFSQLTFSRSLEAPFVAGAKEFLEKNKGHYRFFIASGIPEAELCNIVELRGLRGYFGQIHGSPKDKTDIIKGIIRGHGIKRDEVAYVGDSQSDRIAAEKTKVLFIMRQTGPDAGPADEYCVIKDLSELDGVLEKVRKSNIGEGD